MIPTAAAQIPATVTNAASVAPGSLSAMTPSGTSSRPAISHSHPAEDQHAGDDEQQSVNEQDPPVPGDPLGQITGQLPA